MQTVVPLPTRMDFAQFPCFLVVASEYISICQVFSSSWSFKDKNLRQKPEDKFLLSHSLLRTHSQTPPWSASSSYTLLHRVWVCPRAAVSKLTNPPDGADAPLCQTGGFEATACCSCTFSSGVWTLTDHCSAVQVKGRLQALVLSFKNAWAIDWEKTEDA